MMSCVGFFPLFTFTLQITLFLVKCLHKCQICRKCKSSFYTSLVPNLFSYLLKKEFRRAHFPMLSNEHLVQGSYEKQPNSYLRNLEEGSVIAVKGIHLRTSASN